MHLNAFPFIGDPSQINSAQFHLFNQVFGRHQLPLPASVFGASGAKHSSGIVPDPGATAGTTRYLREDSTFADPLAVENFKPAAYASSAAGIPSYVYVNGVSGVGATITGVANGPLTLDGTAIVSGENVLIKDETGGNAPYNGLYTCTQTGVIAVSPFILTRNTEMNTAGEFVGALVPILNGSTLAGQTWQCSTPPAVVGTNNVTFTVYSGAPQSNIPNSALSAMAANTIKANITGSSATPVDSSLSAILDAEIGSTRGSIAFRGASGWTAAAPGPTGYAWISNGVGADPSYQLVPASTGGALTRIAQVVCAGSQSVITFASIPGIFTNLVIKFSGRSTGATSVVSAYIKFNSDSTSANYVAWWRFIGDTASGGVVAAAISSSSSSNGSDCFITSGSSAATHPFAFARIDIPGYTSTALNKYFHTEGSVIYSSSDNGQMYMRIGQWVSTAAITQIDLTIVSGSFLNGCIATLYGES